MKRNWEVDELVEQFTLLKSEMTLLGNKTGSTRLGFAVLLKFFQSEGRFPEHQQEVPSVVVNQISKQVGVPTELYLQYDWNGRTIKYHRAQIREFLGFHEATVQDAQDVTDWLYQRVPEYDHKIENLQAAAKERFRQLKIEPPSFIQKEQLRNANAQVVNAIFNSRLPQIWGEGTTACASDSKKFGSWDQNLMTEWHIRYGGRGVMIYWHVEKKSTCIYSQLKSCSSSEVGAMIEGLLRHCTDMKVEKNYVDSHGQSEVAFAFCHLLGFQLLPRLKAIHAQKLYRPQAGEPEAYPNLQSVLTRPINWELIRQQYDQMIKYTTALRLGTAEPEAILRRFTRSNPMHPTYQALAELGKAVKTIFLCQYLQSEALRREIHEGLNVVEHWNSANSFIFYGKGGEIATNRLEDQEAAVLSLHLLQSCLVYINTLMIQRVLSEPQWLDLMQPEDLRALTPLIWSHINPYGIFQLDMDERLAIG